MSCFGENGDGVIKHIQSIRGKMITTGIDPIAFTIGVMSVRWYGIFIAFALLLLRATNPISGIAQALSAVAAVT